MFPDFKWSVFRSPLQYICGCATKVSSIKRNLITPPLYALRVYYVTDGALKYLGNVQTGFDCDRKYWRMVFWFGSTFFKSFFVFTFLFWSEMGDFISGLGLVTSLPVETRLFGFSETPLLLPSFTLTLSQVFLLMQLSSTWVIFSWGWSDSGFSRECLRLRTCLEVVICDFFVDVMGELNIIFLFSFDSCSGDFEIEFLDWDSERRKL